MGCEIPKIHIFAYNFWTVSQKIIILVSVDSLGHAESRILFLSDFFIFTIGVYDSPMKET